MGLLDIFKSRAAEPIPLPSGSFTVDRSGEILTSTVVSTFPAAGLKQISNLVLKTFREAQAHELVFTEIIVTFGAITLKARELRGGAIIFLSPRGNPRK
jgi:hypothetical protein